MKKLLLLACACLVASTSAFAQIIQSESRTTQTFYEKPVSPYPCYQGELNVGYETPSAIFFETIHGARFNKYFFAGVGLGYHHISELYIEKDDFILDDGDEGRVPLFVNLKGYYPVNAKFAPYLNLSMGYGIGVDNDGGFYCDFGAGFNYRYVNFGLGLQHHGTWYPTDYYGSYDGDFTFAYNAFYLKIGLCW